MSRPRRDIRRILVANRGEIACRIIQTVQEMGLTAVAVHSDVDAAALHVRRADLAHLLGPANPRESYLNIGKIIDAARATGADAIHPGYGFLSENPAFAEAIAAEGLILIGPSARAIREMGSKARSRELMEAAGVPVVPGFHGADQNDSTFRGEAEKIGWPVLIKAASGGGGKGMRIVREASEFGEALAGARREAEKAFGDGRLLLERYIERPRHIEFQVFGDEHGNLVHLFERECSIQRRHQKIIEESPAPGLGSELRGKMGDAAVAVARAVGYTNAGTVEFIVAPGGEFYFLEMNTRLQVEHPVTEATIGCDLVSWQIRIARGEALPRSQEEILPRGAAIEARLYAEDPDNGFLPSAGKILLYREPTGAGIRADSGIETGSTVPLEYDPILAKIVAWAESREEARQRLIRALDRMAVLGVRTNLPLLRSVADHSAFARGETHTHFLDDHSSNFIRGDRKIPWEAFAAAALANESLVSDSSTPRAGAALRRTDPWDGSTEGGRS